MPLPSLLDLPVDVLRHHVLVRPTLDLCSLAVCRFVCRRLRDMLPRISSPAAWDYWYSTAMPVPVVLSRLKPTCKDLAMDQFVQSPECMQEMKVIYGTPAIFREIIEFPSPVPTTPRVWMIAFWQPVCKLRLFHLDTDPLLSDAVVCGYERVLEWSLGQGAPVGWHLLEEAASSGRLGILQQLVHHVEHGAAGTCRCALLPVLAAAGGHLTVVKWLYYYQMPCLHSNHYDSPRCSFPKAVDDMRSFSGSTYFPTWFDNVLVVATFYGRLEVLRWLRRLNRACFRKFFFESYWPPEWVIYGGHTEVLHWLHDFTRKPPGVDSCRVMVQVGRLDYLQWARMMGGAWNDREVLKMAINCLSYRREFVQELQQKGATWEQVLETGLFQSRSILQYLHDEGVPWPRRVCFDSLMELESFGSFSWVL
jgi:hypothetical protein